MSRRPERLSRPSTLPVGGVPFKMKWDEMPKDSKKDYGETVYPARVMHINAEICVDSVDLDRTLLHEGVHASLLVSGVAGILENFDEKAGFDIEEAVCVAIENNLYPFICALVKRGYFKGEKNG